MDNIFLDFKSISYNFSNYISLELNFLNDYGFNCFKKKANFMRYESPNIFINICYDTKYGVIEIYIGNFKKDSHWINGIDLGMLLKLLDVPIEKQGVRFYSNSPKKMREHIKKLAELIKEYCEPLLRGNSEVFRQIDNKLNAEAQTNLIQEVKNQVEKLWQERNYKKIVEILGHHKDYLAPVDLKRLEYSKKKIKKKK